ncbi:hypothetical protein Q0M89_14215, partial [Staphylococcus aureus]|nr:hypothetical protein [Staphylococcus aureus]
MDVVGDEDSKWRAVRQPLMDASRVISGRNVPFSLPHPTNIDRAPAWLVGRFYFEQPLHSPSASQQRAAELERDKSFPTLDP